MVHGRFVFESKEGEVELAPRVFFGGGTVICRSKVSFGTDVFVAWGTYFYDHDSHSLDFRDRRRDILQQLDDHRSGRANIIVTKDWSKVQSRPIRIEADAWIGMDAVILKGVTVGRGAIVGARSVVTKDVPPWTIVAGNPARVVKELAPELRDRTEA
jgi:galactoside O-acetyltransferase